MLRICLETVPMRRDFPAIDHLFIIGWQLHFYCPSHVMPNPSSQVQTLNNRKHMTGQNSTGRGRRTHAPNGCFLILSPFFRVRKLLKIMAPGAECL